jgi:hypothetical protein
MSSNEDLSIPPISQPPPVEDWSKPPNLPARLSLGKKILAGYRRISGFVFGACCGTVYAVTNGQPFLAITLFSIFVIILPLHFSTKPETKFAFLKLEDFPVDSSLTQRFQELTGDSRKVRVSPQGWTYTYYRPLDPESVVIMRMTCETLNAEEIDFVLAQLAVSKPRSSLARHSIEFAMGISLFIPVGVPGPAPDLGLLCEIGALLICVRPSIYTYNFLLGVRIFRAALKITRNLDAALSQFRMFDMGTSKLTRWMIKKWKSNLVAYGKELGLAPGPDFQQ